MNEVVIVAEILLLLHSTPAFNDLFDIKEAFLMNQALLAAGCIQDIFEG
jgi:hypothetical protein